MELPSSFRLLFEPELMLLDIALQLLNCLLSILKVSLFLIHFLNKLIVLGPIDSQQILLMSPLLLLLLQLPLLVVDTLVRRV